MEHDILTEPLPIATGPRWGTIDGPGLGVEVDEDAVAEAAARYRTEGQYLPVAGLSSSRRRNGDGGRLDGKVALVVGGGSGMGRAGAAAMAAEGAAVVVSDIALDRAEAVAASIGTPAAPRLRCTSTSRRPSTSSASSRTLSSRFGRLDVLYHCAADVHFVNTQDKRLTELDDDVWRRMIDIHLTGTFLVLKHVGRQMIAQGSGSIIVSSTVDALVGCAGLDSYTAAKGGVTSMVRSFAAGVGRDGVRVNAIAPSFVSTEPQQVWLDDADARATIAEPPHPARPDARADRAFRRLPRERRIGGCHGHRLPDRRRLHGVQGAGRRDGHDAGRLLVVRPMAGIELEHVTKAFAGGVVAVDDVNLTIADGEFMVLVGPSGCGKSTLLRMIAGLEEITDGTISIGDATSPSCQPPERDIAMVFQNYALYPHMSVRENLGFGLSVRHTPKRGDRAPRRTTWRRCSASRISSTASRRTSPAASGSASRWAARSSASRRPS